MSLAKLQEQREDGPSSAKAIKFPSSGHTKVDLVFMRVSGQEYIKVSSHVVCNFPETGYVAVTA